MNGNISKERSQRETPSNENLTFAVDLKRLWSEPCQKAPKENAVRKDHD